MRRVAPYLCLCALLFGGARAEAQEVREETSGHASSLRAVTAQAKKEGKAGFPNLYDGDAGTVVFATFDLRNADLILMTADAAPERLLRSAQTAAKGAGFPKADFLTFSGPRFESVDVEFNDSLVKRGEARSEIALPLGRLRRALEEAGVPKPIAFAVRVDPLTTAALDGKPLPVGTRLLLAGEIPDGAILARKAERPPWAVPAAWAFALAGVAFVGWITLLPFRILLRRPAAPAPVETLDPKEVQAKYDAAKPWKTFGPLILPAVLLPLLTLGKPWLETLFAAVGMVFPPPPRWLPFAVFLPALLLLPVSVIVRRRRDRDAPTSRPDVHPEDDEGALFQKGLFLLPLMLLPGMILLMASLAFLTLLRGLDPSLRMLLAIGPGTVGLVAFLVLSMRASRGSVTTLGPGDPVHDAARELAARAGVRVRKVLLRRSAAPNAFADLGNNVGVTTRLRREFPPEEVRAILAHEIGHLRHRHVWRGFAFSLVFLAAWLGLRFGADGWMRAHLGEGPYALWSSPVWGFVALPFLSALVQGRGSRRREFEADRFAVEAVGDPEIVASALRRVHSLAQTPGTLRPTDEALSSHPSLSRRLAALKGMTAD